MTRQEEIRGHLAGEYCSFVNQEYCVSSDCPKGGKFCDGAYQYADGQMGELAELGVVIKVERELPHKPIYGEKRIDEALAMYQIEINRAGYVAVESLIAEE